MQDLPIFTEDDLLTRNTLRQDGVASCRWIVSNTATGVVSACTYPITADAGADSTYRSFTYLPVFKARTRFAASLATAITNFFLQYGRFAILRWLGRVS
jgi:hypothetical protein